MTDAPVRPVDGRAHGRTSCPLSTWASRVTAMDVGSLAADEFEPLLAEVRRLQRCLDGLVTRIGAGLDSAAAKGRSQSARDALRGAGAVGARQADREARRIQATDGVPGLGDALSAGEVGGDHVDSIGRRLKDLDDAARGRLDASALIDRAKALPPETFDRWLRREVDAITGDHGLADTVARQKASEFRHWFDRSAGMGRFSGSLDPERYEMLCNAVERRVVVLAGKNDGQDEGAGGADEVVRKDRCLAATALVDLVTGGGGVGSSGVGVPAVTVLVDEQTLLSGPHGRSIRQTESGHDLPPETIARLCCDATLRRVVLDGRGVPIDVGRRYRTATDGQWAALKAVYSSCAWNGCDAPIGWCQAHHIKEWERGGPTDFNNLVPLCNRHHHLVHEGRWSVSLLADRTLRIRRPDGRCVADARPADRRHQEGGESP